jgi:O-antigen/teichoic acid export membrane protein
VAAAAIVLLATALLPFVVAALVGPEEWQSLQTEAWMLPLLVALASSMQFGLAWCTRRGDFLTYSLGQFCLPLATVSVQSLAPFIGLANSIGLIVGTVFGYCVTVLLVWVRILRKDRDLIAKGLRFKRGWVMARRYSIYPRYMTPYTILATLRDRMPYFLLGRFADIGTVGFFSIAQRFVNTPRDLVTGAVRPVFFHYAAQRNLPRLGAAVLIAMKALLWLLVPNLVILWFHAEFLLRFILGPQWGDAAFYAIALSVPAIPGLLGGWLDRVFDITRRQRSALAMEVLFSTMTISPLLIGLLVYDSAFIAIVGYGVANTIFFMIWIWFIFRVAGFPHWGPLRLLILTLGLAGAGIFLLWVLEQSLPIAAAIAVYYAFWISLVTRICVRYYRKLDASLPDALPL